MQLYYENEKAFLLIHFNLNYGTNSLPYIKTWIGGTKNIDSAGRSLYLPIPDLYLAQLDTFSNININAKE